MKTRIIFAMIIIGVMLSVTIPIPEAQADAPVEGYWKYVEDLTEYQPREGGHPT